MIVKTIKFNGKSYGLTGLMTFDEVEQVDQLFDPAKLEFNEKIRAAKTKAEQIALVKEIRLITVPQKQFIKQMIDSYIQMPPADRKAITFVDAYVLFNLVYQASVEVPENLEQPSAAGSTSDSTQSKTPSTFLEQ